MAKGREPFGVGIAQEHTRATGASLPQRGLMAQGTMRKRAIAITVKNHTDGTDTAPVGISLCAVLGFWASRRLSARRLKAMAAARAAVNETAMRTGSKDQALPWRPRRLRSMPGAAQKACVRS